MKLTVIGCSDAFGSGGRLQTCFHVAHEDGEFLIDCGATALIGLSRQGLDPNRVAQIFITHLHGDHFSGLVWWLIHAIHVTKRTAPLTVFGPRGIKDRFEAAAEALFPGSVKTERPFELVFSEYAEQVAIDTLGVRVVPFEVIHPSGAPPYALRFTVQGKTLAFSGDTEWTEALVSVGASADLFISECSAFDREARYHLNWRTLERNIDRIGARRLLLTHMGPEMLANCAGITHPSVTLAEDGMVLEV